MKNNYAIHIPTPCHENWEAMTPVEQGRFCQSCAKQVVDFSMMTDQEVLNYFSKSTGNTCGRFNNDQLQRPLQPTRIEKKKTWWVAAMMPLLLFFSKAAAQKKQPAKNIIKINEAVMGLTGDVVVTKISHPTDYWPVGSDDDGQPTQTPVKKREAQVARLTVERRKGDSDFVVSGAIVDSRLDEPLVYATVVIKGTKTAVATDSIGNFSIKGHTTGNNAVLSISSVGFETTDVLVEIKDSVESAKKIERNIIGVIVDATDGKPLSSVTVMLKGTSSGAASNDEGVFKLKANTQGKSAVIKISYVGYKNAEKIVALDEGNTVIDTIKLERADVTEVTAGVVVCAFVKPKKTDTIPTFIQKVFHPNAFKVYPNPAQSGSYLTVEVKTEGSYSVQLYSSNGNLIMAQPVEAIKGVTQTAVNIPAGLTPGMYYIRLFDNKKKKQYTDKLMVL